METGLASLVSVNNDKDMTIFVFQNTNSDALAAFIGDFFKQRGYKLEEGDPKNGVYGTGSAVARALVGGLVKRFKFKVAIYDSPNGTSIQVSKAMSGAMGGAIGYVKMNNEYGRIVEGIKEKAQ